MVIKNHDDIFPAICMMVLRVEEILTLSVQLVRALT